MAMGLQVSVIYVNRIQEIMCMIIRELAKLGLELELTYLHRAYADAVGTRTRFLRILICAKNISCVWPLDVRHPAVRERDGLDAVFEERQLRCAK